LGSSLAWGIRMAFVARRVSWADPGADPPLTGVICEAQAIREGEDTKLGL
jgi:hypothetical protein